MKKLFYSFIIILSVIACGSTSYYKSIWHDDVKNVPATVFHKTNGLILSVSNNNDFLFVSIESNFPHTIKKIMKLGLSVWISKGINPNKTYAIHYPLPFKNTRNKVALEGFNEAQLIATPLKNIETIKIESSISAEQMKYTIKLPLSEIDMKDTKTFTISIASFSLGKQEYLSGLTTSEEIEHRLNDYKANSNWEKDQPELVPFYSTFLLAKKPNKNP